MNESAQEPPAIAAPRPLETALPGLFRTLFDAYPDALIVADSQGTIGLANPSAAKLLGYTTEQLVGLNVDALVPDSIRPRHASYREAYGRAPRPRPMGTQMELVAKRRDGTEVMVEIALSPLLDGGTPLVVAAIRDIGAYPRIKQALRRALYSEHLAQFGRLAVDARDPAPLLRQAPQIAQQALQAAAAVLLLADAQRSGLRTAGAAHDSAARPARQVEALARRVLEHSRAIVIADVRDAADADAPAEWHDDGIGSVSAVPVADRSRNVGVLVVQSREPGAFGADELRFLEQLSNLIATSLQRAHSEEQLNHAQRLESVGQLTGGIAHDFNNLLTVIQGNLQIIEELPAITENPYGQQLVAAAARASRRGAELTSKLLAFSRRQVLQPSAVDVPQMLNSLADMLRRTVDQRIRIGVEIAGACPPVFADPGQLESALLNIAINARDAMPEGGTLRFSAAICSALPAQMRGELDDPSARDDGYIAISVTDNGTGMPEDVRERAFEPFFTTKEAGRGTGLGLSTVYGFVKQSKGAIAIDSAPGQGTTITLVLPRVWSAAAAAADAAPAAQASLPPGLRVLLVEDDTAVRAVAGGFLRSLGCQVTEAANGEGALLTLGADSHFQLLLSDISLGAGLQGTELAVIARSRHPGLPVLLMSGFSADVLSGTSRQPLAWELLRKPFSRDDLARAISQVLAAAH